METLNAKKYLFLFIATACLGFSYGHSAEEQIGTKNAGHKKEMLSEDGPEPKTRMANPLTFLMQKGIVQNPKSSELSLVNLFAAMEDLKAQFQGFAPYLAKLATPIIRTVAHLLEKAHTYFVEYIHNLSPETVQNLQKTLLNFFGKLFDIDLIKALLQFAFGGIA